MAKHVFHGLILLLLAACLSPAPAARAQEGLPLRDQAYLRDTVRLAGVLGSAHGVRYVCNGEDDQYWRQHMIELLTLEAPHRGALRQSMVSAFNDSFSNARRRYPYCDQNTVDAEKRYATEGRDLADRLARYYFEH
ncbi:MAG: TIGR02301 family protein [Hyphomonadaceae bacterium]|nr:TIGR02301 family protein [Hyphomonadaceae bacterium]